MAIKMTDTSNYDAIASAIRTMNGEQTTYTPAEMAPAILALPTGGGSEAPVKDVNYYDYDGKILYSYSAAEFLELEEHPECVTHSDKPLVDAEWNWDLADAQAYVEEYGKLEIGEMYITEDDATHIIIELPKGYLTPYIRWSGTATVDWGDGSTPDTETGDANGDMMLSHTYAQPGKYEIVITPDSGFKFLKTIIWNGVGEYQNAYTSSVKHIFFGTASAYNGACGSMTGLETVTVPPEATISGTFAGCTGLKHLNAVGGLNQGALNNCMSLRSLSVRSATIAIPTQCPMRRITVPTGGNASLSFGSGWKSLEEAIVPKLYGSQFQDCLSLRRVIYQSTFTNLYASAFSGCMSLLGLTLPDTVTKINSGAFATCRTMKELTIPSSVTTIAATAFAYMTGLKELHFKSATPPTVANSSAFTDLPTDCIIYVPTGKLSAYTSATNYPSSGTYTYREEA